MEPSNESKRDYLEDAPLNEIPEYYVDPSGSPYQSRLGSAYSDFNKQLYKVIKSDVFTAERINEGQSIFGNDYYTFEVTRKHKLGFRPLVRGTYVIRSSTGWTYSDEFPVGTRGQIPEYRNIAGWNTHIKELNENEVTVRIITNLDIELGITKIEFKLDYLTLESVT